MDLDWMWKNLFSHVFLWWKRASHTALAMPYICGKGITVMCIMRATEKEWVIKFHCLSALWKSLDNEKQWTKRKFRMMFKTPYEGITVLGFINSLLFRLKLRESVGALIPHPPKRESTVLQNVFGNRWNYTVSFAGASFIFGFGPLRKNQNYVISPGFCYVCFLNLNSMAGLIATFIFKIRWMETVSDMQ